MTWPHDIMWTLTQFTVTFSAKQVPMTLWPWLVLLTILLYHSLVQIDMQCMHAKYRVWNTMYIANAKNFVSQRPVQSLVSTVMGRSLTVSIAVWPELEVTWHDLLTSRDLSFIVVSVIQRNSGLDLIPWPLNFPHSASFPCLDRYACPIWSAHQSTDCFAICIFWCSPGCSHDMTWLKWPLVSFTAAF